MFKHALVADIALGPLQDDTYISAIHDHYPQRNHSGHCLWNMLCSKCTPGSRDVMLSLAPFVKNDVEGNTCKVVCKQII